MAETPTELSGAIVIHHPNCGCDCQFMHYDAKENLNYFECVKCHLSFAVMAFVLKGTPPPPEPPTENLEEFDPLSDQRQEDTTK